MLTLAPSLTQRAWTWVSFKDIVVLKYLQVQYDEEVDRYVVFGYDGPEVHLCVIWKDDVPPAIALTYTQEQNDADKADFEANYKPTANGQVEPKSKDGRRTVRDSVANRTNHFKLRVYSFTTAAGSGSIHNVNPVTDADYGDCTLTMFDATGSVTTDPALAAKEWLDLMPHYDYEIIGGYMDIPDAVKNGATNQWFVSVIGVPDLPPQMYGSIDYISEANLELITTTRIVSDGRAVSFLPYNYGGYPTNKMRFIIKHPVGAQQRFQFYLEHFV